MSYTTNKSGISNFADHCVRNGLTHIVCSPGSRNAPLVIAFDQHPQIRTYVVHDERSAGFYALGLSLGLKKPVAVCCTSGSAVTNYFPAVTEAYYQNIPLVVLSADRPEEWVNHGDGQTIMQAGIFGKHVHHFETIEEEVVDKPVFDSKVQRAFDKLYNDWKGPIHFNFPLTEPLYNKVEKDYVGLSERKQTPVPHSIEPNELDYIKGVWNNAPKKMILCGQLEKINGLSSLLHELSDDVSLVVLVENTSNLVDRNFVHCIDRTLVSINNEELEDFKPDLLITLGGAVVSKKIKAFLRDSNAVHWKVGFDFPDMDTYRKKERTFLLEPKEFIELLLESDLNRNVSSYGNRWKQRNFQVRDFLTGYMETVPYSDLKVFEVLLDMVPEGSNIHMGNSSVVRYCQLFDPINSMTYFSNRGTSGIDGSTSTACGVSIAMDKKLSIFFSGDVSFFYDSNALWNNNLPSNLVIVLINNGGGGIFRIIDGPNTSDQLEKYFEAKHNYSAEYLCKAFDVNYTSASDIQGVESEFAKVLTGAMEKATVIEVFTKELDNEVVLKEYFNAIAEKCLIGKVEE